MTDEQRAEIAADLSGVLVDLLVASLKVRGIAEEEVLSTGLIAAVGAAAAIAAVRCVDPAATVALIHCTAEAACEDIFA